VQLVQLLQFAWAFAGVAKTREGAGGSEVRGRRKRTDRQKLVRSQLPWTFSPTGCIVLSMKKLAAVTLFLALSIPSLLLGSCSERKTPSATPANVITVELSGTPGASFTGEVVRAGARVLISGVLPWKTSETNISRLEIRKANIDDTLTLKARGGGSEASAQVIPGRAGVRLDMENGWSVETIQ
jgi:hypothetical protein